MTCVLHVKIGLIAAACGQLDAVLQDPSKEAGTEVCAVKPYQNRIPLKAAAYGARDYVYGGCNGLHF